MIGEIGVLIPIFGIGCGMLAIWTNHRQKMARIEASSRATKGGELNEHFVQQTRDLEDRVRVLERIVTDKGFDVAHQIEALRDAREASAIRLENRSGHGEHVQ